MKAKFEIALYLLHIFYIYWIYKNLSNDNTAYKGSFLSAISTRTKD